MSRNIVVDKPTLAQLMAWCHQATSHYWANVGPDVCRHMASFGHNELNVRLCSVYVEIFTGRNENLQVWDFVLYDILCSINVAPNNKAITCFIMKSCQFLKQANSYKANWVESMIALKFDRHLGRCAYQIPGNCTILKLHSHHRNVLQCHRSVSQQHLCLWCLEVCSQYQMAWYLSWDKGLITTDGVTWGKLGVQDQHWPTFTLPAVKFCDILIASCKTVVPPVHQQWRYCSLVQSQRWCTGDTTVLHKAIDMYTKTFINHIVSRWTDYQFSQEISKLTTQGSTVVSPVHNTRNLYQPWRQWVTGPEWLCWAVHTIHESLIHNIYEDTVGESHTYLCLMITVVNVLG